VSDNGVTILRRFSLAFRCRLTMETVPLQCASFHVFESSRGHKLNFLMAFGDGECGGNHMGCVARGRYRPYPPSALWRSQHWTNQLCQNTVSDFVCQMDKVSIHFMKHIMLSVIHACSLASSILLVPLLRSHDKRELGSTHPGSRD